MWINIRGPNNIKRQYAYKIKTNTPLLNLMKEYCYQIGFSMSDVSFQFDGQPIRTTDKPEDFGMEVGDLIDVFQI